MITAYCDGSCPRPHKHGGWAYVILHDYETPVYIDKGGVNVATNNTMELQAAIECMKGLIHLELQQEACTIWTDSMYVVNGMQHHRHVWAETNWVSSSNGGMPIKNPEQWKELHELAKQFKSLRFNHVKGHAGHYWNERVDGLAGSAMRAARRA